MKVQFLPRGRQPAQYVLANPYFFRKFFIAR